MKRRILIDRGREGREVTVGSVQAALDEIRAQEGVTEETVLTRAYDPGSLMDRIGYDVKITIIESVSVDELLEVSTPEAHAEIVRRARLVGRPIGPAARPNTDAH